MQRLLGQSDSFRSFEYELVDLPALTVEELGDAPLLRVILELIKRATDGTLRIYLETKVLEIRHLTSFRDSERSWRLEQERGVARAKQCSPT